ncbi:glycosyltransferase family 39 protein, partial [bacterium]|nr:glycosyltransferase family 39 protein [candidate division CSSED10-310 bacterium]
MNKLKTLFIILGIAIVVSVYLNAVLDVSIRVFDPDELEHLHAARALNRDSIIYKDFFEHHMPLLYLLLKPLHLYLQDTISYLFSGRWLMVGFSVITCLLIFLICRIAYSSASAYLSTFIFISHFLFRHKAMEIRPDNVMIPAFLLAVLLLIRGEKYKSKFLFFLSGLFMSLAFLTSIKASYGIIGCFAAIWLNRKRYEHSKTIWNRIFFVGFGSAIPFLVTLGYLFKYSMVQEFFYYTLFINLKWQYNFQPWRSLSIVSMNDPALTTLLVIAWIFFLYRAAKKNFDNALSNYPLIIGSVILLFVLFLTPNPYLQNLSYPLPFLSMFA